MTAEMSNDPLAARDRPPLPTRDKTIIGLLLFFIVVALTLELYYVVYAHELPARASSNWMAYLFSLYGVADSTYFDQVSSLSLSLEMINVFVTQPLNAWLIFAILKRRRYRHVLQLIVSSYLTYSVVLYFFQEQLSGFVHMRQKTPYGFFMFYAPNLPWLLGYAYMAYDSARALLGRRPERRAAAADAAGAGWESSRAPVRVSR